MIVNRDIATSAAAELSMGRLNRSLRPTVASSKLLEAAIIPIFGIRWSAQVIRRVGSRKLNGILCVLRNSPLSQTSYARISQLWKDALRLDLDVFPAEWESWRSLVETFDLDERSPLPAWIPTIQLCLSRGFALPSTLSLSTHSQLSTMGADFSPQ